ncbi:glycosyltransferase [Paenibacillus tarimensis]|uniref:glycosyltransferase n=1 Tax=Paenibacillus tarimensis TaxID=416012 RepID=UPI001F1AB605|nr:glycosyltransferase [Paenibacillus tarimensis]MCF2944238.1 glycosyltransferase [Paenibacillus tarimensis]
MAKILHVVEYTKGGVETHLNEVLSYQRDRHDIYLIASEHNSNPDTLQISRERLTLYPYRRKPKYMLAAIFKIRKAIRQLQPDIVHVHGTFAGVFARMTMLGWRKRPVTIYCSHGWAFLMDTSAWKKRAYGFVERMLSAATDAIINISNNEYETSLKYKLPAHKSVVIYNGVSDRRGKEQVEPVQVKNDKVNLLFIGRFDRQKGFDLLLDTFHKHDLQHIHLMLVGGSVLQDGHSHSFPPNATHYGWVDNKEIDRYIHSADAVIVPSRWEGFGIVAIEALRSGKPVIVSNRGALKEIIQPGVNGFVFDFDQPDELYRILKELSKEQLVSMHDRCLASFAERFHASVMNEKIEEVYVKSLEYRGNRTAVISAPVAHSKVGDQHGG